jgi:hypothetical protein
MKQKKDWDKWVLFLCEVCEKISNEKEKELVRKRITKKMEMLGKILANEIKEIKTLKKLEIASLKKQKK